MGRAKVEVGGPCWEGIHGAQFLPCGSWLPFSSTSQTKSPPSSAATAMMMTSVPSSWALGISVPPGPSRFHSLKHTGFIPLSLSSQECRPAPQSCVKIISALLFFSHPKWGNLYSFFWNPTTGILELIFRCVEVFQTKPMPSTDKAQGVFIVGKGKLSVLMWQEHSHMPGCSMASFNLEKGNKRCR